MTALLVLAIFAQDRLWDDLAHEDAGVAYEALWALRSSSKRLRDKLVPRVDAARVRAWIADLASDDIVRRGEAERGLRDAGLHAEAALREALRTARDADHAGCLRALLDTLDTAATRHLRAIRALQVAGDQDALAEIARSGRTTREREMAATTCTRKPASDGAQGVRAFDEFAGLGSVDWEGALDALESGDAAAKRRAGEYLLAALRQVCENDATEDRGDIVRAFGLRACGDDALAAALWLIHEEPYPGFRPAGIRAFARIQGARADAEIARVLDPPHTTGEVLRLAVEEAGLRKLQALAPAVERLCLHHRSDVRDAARNAAPKLGLAKAPAFDPEKALDGPPGAQLRLIGSMVMTDAPREAPFRLFLTKGPRGQFAGWLLETRPDGFRALDTCGQEVALPKEGTLVKPWSLAQEAETLAIKIKLEQSSVTAQEGLVASWAFARGDRKTAAAILLRRLDDTQDDDEIVRVMREHMGRLYHREMIEAFSHARDYGRAIAFAKHLSKPVFDDFRYQSRAKELRAQLERRADDFVALKLPDADEWARLKATLSREEQIRYLLARFRLLNCFAWSDYGDIHYEATQHAGPLHDRGEPVINPRVELLALKPTLADIELLAERLADRNYMPTYATVRGRSVELDSVNRMVADIVNGLVHRELADVDAPDLEKHARDVAAWARERRGWSAFDTALEAIRTARAWHYVEEAAEVCRSERDPRVLDAVLARRQDFDPYVIAALCRHLDLPEAASAAREWLKSENEETRLEAARILVRHGRRAQLEGYGELKAILEGENGLRHFGRGIVALLDVGTADARAVAASCVAKPSFDPTDDSGAPLRRMVLAGWTEASDYILREFDNANVRGTVNGSWKGESVSRPWLAADRVADVVDRMRGDDHSYPSTAPEDERAKAREELKAWFRGQVALIREGKPHGIRQP